MSDTTTGTSQTLYPALRYADAHGAIRFLNESFGFVTDVVYDGSGDTVAHAQLRLGGPTGSVVMLGSASNSGPYPVKPPGELGGITGSVYCYVADVDAHCERARASGARIAIEPYATDYGTREYAAYDCEGYWWTFGTYRP